MAANETQSTWRRGFFVKDGIEYPTSEERNLMGTTWHTATVHSATSVLWRYFGFLEGVVINWSFPICYDPDDLTKYLIPDLLVVRAEWGGDEEVYRTWEAPIPEFVLEVASVATDDRELGFKKDEYESLGVEEYWQLDQSGELLEKPLVGHRLTEHGFRSIGPSGQRAGQPEYWSEALGLYLRVRYFGGRLAVQFRCPITGEDLPADEDLNREYIAISNEIEELQKQADEHRAAVLAVEQRIAAARKRQVEVDHVLSLKDRLAQ